MWPGVYSTIQLSEENSGAAAELFSKKNLDSSQTFKGEGKTTSLQKFGIRGRATVEKHSAIVLKHE